MEDSISTQFILQNICFMHPCNTKQKTLSRMRAAFFFNEKCWFFKENKSFSKKVFFVKNCSTVNLWLYEHQCYLTSLYDQGKEKTSEHKGNDQNLFSVLKSLFSMQIVPAFVL